MSAIAGIVNFNKEPVKIEEIHSVMGALQKFPADDIQVWKNENVFFGCHAQWITPESIGEPLPFYDSERQCTITADAIIDNREELFESLQVDRDKRKTIPDSQLILLAYYKWGEESPKYLVGDFAFMIWDEWEQKLFGARDFSGSRTLYYYQDQNHLAFCTIMEPLFTLPYIKKELNEVWLAEFLAIPLNHESVDVHSTVYKDVKQIPPSHSILIKEGRIIFSRYSLLKEREKLKLNSDEEYEEAFQDVFQRAVTDRLRTHRKVGAHLSGGLDSGSVASFAAKALKNKDKKLHSFSYVPIEGFEDWTPKSRVPDERPFIQSTIDYVGNIKPNYLDFKKKNSLSEVDDWLDIMEMPYKFFENSYWVKGIFEEASMQDIGVLLSGQRGNWTISWGPMYAYQAALLKKFNLIRFYKEVNSLSKNIGIKKSRLFSIARNRAYPFFNRSNAADGYPLLINPLFAEKTDVFNKLQNHGIDTTGTVLADSYEMKRRHFEKLFYWNINGTYATKLSLHHKLWDRDPTNDLRVINYCLSVPEDQYVQNGQGRSLIRRATKDYLPDKVRLNQRTKGLQGADGILRMQPTWQEFVEEIQLLCKKEDIMQYLNLEVIQHSLEKIKDLPTPDAVFQDDFKILMRSLIFYRFMKSFI